MIKAGIVGLGWWGRTLVNAVQKDGVAKTETLRFVRAATRTPDKARDFAEAEGLPLATDFRELVADPDLDALVFATPHSQHVAQVVEAARAGKHVFVEKPLALRKADAEQAVSACRAAGVVLGLGHNRRFLPAYRDLRDMVRAGELGRILHIEANFSAPAGYRYHHGMWRASAEESPAGGMTGLGIHCVDAMIDLAGEVGRINAWSKRQVLKDTGMDDTTFARIEFATGATGYLGTLTATAMCWRLQAFGTEGWGEMRGTASLAVAKLGDEWAVRDYEPVEMERLELECFAETINGRADYPVTADQAIHGVAVLEGIVDSAAKQGAMVVV